MFYNAISTVKIDFFVFLTKLISMYSAIRR